ncbi:phage tail protein [Pseudomonas alvandae]|uniref:phage tail-collar fiber domain-containing protein n=1 Tax=Pseudomonas TaxID=286 RepID=UPI00389A8FA2
MAASITLAGESLIAEKQAAHEVLEVVRFVLALVPDLDPEGPVDRAAPMPPLEQIVHTQAITQKGFVNPNQVVYSLMMGSNIGDFDWNWIGLQTAENVLLSVGYVPVQQKRKNIPPHQIGNNVTRNMMLLFDGAQALTDVTIDASTWQHDFTVRLHDIDERERQSNRAVYGRACFFGSSLQLVNVAQGVQINPGLAFLEGMRLELTTAVPVTPASPPTKAWLDVALERQENSAGVAWSVQWGSPRTDYVDSAGVQHYLIALADLTTATEITDLRETVPIDRPLVQYFASHNGDYPDLRARGTTKQDVGLDQLPNAKSDDPRTNDSEILATTAALNNLDQQISDSLVGMVASFDMETAPPGWLKRNGANVSRTTYAKLFAVLGTRYGAGDGSTTFNIGDSRGLFIRGLDDGARRDPDRRLGTIQQGQNLSHSHTAIASVVGNHAHSASTNAQGQHAHTGTTNTQGGHSHTIDLGRGEEDSRNTNSRGGVHRGYADLTSEAGAHSHTLSIVAAGQHSHTVTVAVAGAHDHAITVNVAGGNEARPINQALLICIKY